MTIKAVLDTRTKRKTDTYPIYVRVSEGTKMKYINVGHRVGIKHWTGSEVKKTHPIASVINSAITDTIAKINKLQADAQLRDTTFNLKRLNERSDTLNFTKFLFEAAVNYEKKKMHNKVNVYMRMYREIKLLFGDMTEKDINDKMVERLDIHFIENENNQNTRNKKMRTYSEALRAFYKINDIYGKNPFSDVKIKTTKGKKEKLTDEEIKRLEEILLDGYEDIARDMFLFAFYCKGQRFGVVLLARWSQINNGRIYFKQMKGSNAVSVKIHERLQKLLLKHKNKSEYIFPIIKKKIPKEKKEQDKMVNIYNTVINKYLKKVADKADIKINLTTHVTRHSFAFALKRNKVDIHVIKEALGLSSYKIAENYLKDLGDETFDDDISKVYGN